MQIETTKLTDWLARLVQIPSVCPRQVGPRAGEPGELKIAQTVAAWFGAFGAEVEIEDVLPGRPNVYGMWPGESDDWLALDIHVDTVGVEQMIDPPFDGRVENGRVYGRGAVDTKASLGVILAMLEQMSAAGRRPKSNLLVVATMGEESGLIGAGALPDWVGRKGLHLKQLMVAEPTMCAPVYGHKGGMGLKIEVKGKTAHSSQPHFGQNAIQAAAHMIVALEKEHEQLQTLTPATEVGNGTLSVTIIQGGIGGNVVPDSCIVNVGRRVVPGEDAAGERDALIKLAKESCPLPIEVTQSFAADAFYQDPDIPWIHQLSEWAGEAAMVVPYGTNALRYLGLADEMVIMGPGSIDQAHGEVEWVEISELEKMAHVYSQWLGI